MKNIEHSLKIYDVVISYDFVKSKVNNNILPSQIYFTCERDIFK